MIDLYLAGYAGRKATELRRAALLLDALVVDVRLSPRSPRPEWRKYPLIGLIKGRYLWVQDWGNVNYANGGPVQIRDFERGLEALRGAGDWRRLILLCGCARTEQCHRLVLADELAWNHLPCVVYELDWADPASSVRISTYDALRRPGSTLMESMTPARPDEKSFDDLPHVSFADAARSRRRSLLGETNAAE
ncbi:MAG: DUF488 family protein [Armatimonadetes bacterium]|nr:DUF488 family protein [Armatimonadota bacterium]